MEAEAARNRWFFGGAVNPRDKDVIVTEDGDDLVFTGRKSFSTGSKVSDVTVLEGVLEGTDDHVFAIVPSDSEGLTFHDDWDNIGQRLTESGGVTLDGVRTPWSSAAGYVDKQFRPRVYNTLNVPTIQLVFVNFYLGIAGGALETAATYTRRSPAPGCTAATSAPSTSRTSSTPTATSPPSSGRSRHSPTPSPPRARNCTTTPTRSPRQARGDFEVRVAAVKARATDVALEITNRIFEVTGARATATSEGLDRFWRNVRTHTLHDPVAYKRREVGRWVLDRRTAEPTWYS